MNAMAPVTLLAIAVIEALSVVARVALAVVSKGWRRIVLHTVVVQLQSQLL
jgi:hypothetical protein